MRELLAYLAMFFVLWALIEPKEFGAWVSKVFTEINEGWQEKK